jgi:hypothetical protein
MDGDENSGSGSLDLTLGISGSPAAGREGGDSGAVENAHTTSQMAKAEEVEEEYSDDLENSHSGYESSEANSGGF